MNTFQRHHRTAQAHRLGLTPNHKTLCRIPDGNQLSNRVELVSDDGPFVTCKVASQSDPLQAYTVRFNETFSSCTCPDWKRHDQQAQRQGAPMTTHECKHLLAARVAHQSGKYTLHPVGQRPVPVNDWFLMEEIHEKMDKQHGKGQWKIYPHPRRKKRNVQIVAYHAGNGKWASMADKVVEHPAVPKWFRFEYRA